MGTERERAHDEEHGDDEDKGRIAIVRDLRSRLVGGEAEADVGIVVVEDDGRNRLDLSGRVVKVDAEVENPPVAVAVVDIDTLVHHNPSLSAVAQVAHRMHPQKVHDSSHVERKLSDDPILPLVVYLAVDSVLQRSPSFSFLLPSPLALPPHLPPPLSSKLS